MSLRFNTNDVRFVFTLVSFGVHILVMSFVFLISTGVQHYFVFRFLHICDKLLYKSLTRVQKIYDELDLH
jgi:hypothetical protein